MKKRPKRKNDTPFLPAASDAIRKYGKEHVKGKATLIIGDMVRRHLWAVGLRGRNFRLAEQIEMARGDVRPGKLLTEPLHSHVNVGDWRKIFQLFLRMVPKFTGKNRNLPAEKKTMIIKIKAVAKAQLDIHWKGRREEESTVRHPKFMLEVFDEVFTDMLKEMPGQRFEEYEAGWHKEISHSENQYFYFEAGTVGFEPTTFCLGVSCSIQAELRAH